MAAAGWTEVGTVGYVGADEALLFFVGWVVVGVAFVRSSYIVVIVAPFGLWLLVLAPRGCKGMHTKWFANSSPTRLALAYSKSMTMSCLC
jgi:hypothetical protein